MLKRKFAFIISICFPLIGIADEYRITVKREDSNIYSITGQDALIITKYCYEYAYSEDALLMMNGYSGSIVFLDQGEKCDVEAVYILTTLEQGTYNVTITHEGDDWYSMLEADMCLKTYACYEYVYCEDALLVVHGNGLITLYINGSDYMVEGIYQKAKL